MSDDVQKPAEKIQRVRARHDFTGTCIGRLTAVAATADRWKGKVVWLWRCDCGQERRLAPGRLRDSGAQSCGCLRREMSRTLGQRHGGKRGNGGKLRHGPFADGKPSLTFGAYWDMIRRHRSNMSPAWIGHFQQFLADMGERPEGTVLLRIDSERVFELGNCKWVPKSEAPAPRRYLGKMLTWQGVTLCQQDWAKRLGISKSTMNWRVRRRLFGIDLFKPAESGVRNAQ